MTRVRNNGDIIDFLANNDNSILFKFKEKITGQTKSDGTNDVEILVLLKKVSNFCRTLDVSLINCEINLIPIYSVT